MKLKKEFVVVSHCILNQHAVIPGRERARGTFPLAISLLNQGVALLQLPCPEFLTLGKERPPMTYQEYVAIPGYRQKCQSMLQPVIQQIKSTKRMIIAIWESSGSMKVLIVPSQHSEAY